MTTQSWDFMMQSVSKISKEQKRVFLKEFQIWQGELRVGDMSLYNQERECKGKGKRDLDRLRYEGSKWRDLVSSVVFPGP